jgi:peptidoglycan hydrolase-like protein with peptidoglycan-binding domain
VRSRPALRVGDESDDVRSLQLALNRHLGAMHLTLLNVDGVFGDKTRIAVRRVQRVAGLQRSGAVDDATWTALDAEPRPTVVAGDEEGPDYDRMLSDGLLDVTMGIGFDEHGVLAGEEDEIVRGLTDVRGFAADDARGRQLLTAAQRPDLRPGAGMYVKENATTSGAQPVHAVVRLILAGAGASGGQARHAMEAGMAESDVALYGGHARYGTGPDFDRNMTVVVDWASVDRTAEPWVTDALVAGGSVTYTDYELLQHDLGGADARAIARLERLETAGVARLVRSNEGNLRLTSSSHTREFGGWLMERALGGQRTDVAPLVAERRYRLWMFNGCRTRDYESTVRAAGEGAGAADLGLITTRISTQLRSYAETLLTTLDGLIAQEGARALSDRVEDATPFERDSHRVRL